MWSPALPVSELTSLLLAPQSFVTTASAPSTRNRRSPTQPVTNEQGLHRILQLHRDGASLATIAAALNVEGFSSPAGHRWHPSSVARVIADIAYRARRSPQARASGSGG